MDEQDQYSVFDEIPPQKRSKQGGQFHRVIYYIFAIYFIILSTSRWAYFFAYKKLAITGDTVSVNGINFPYLLSAISGTAIIISSIILFVRKSMRAAIGLLILGALLELIIFGFLRNQ